MTETRTYTQAEYDAGAKQAFEAGRQEAANHMGLLVASIKGQRDAANDTVADLNVTIMQLNQRLADYEASKTE